MSGARDLRALLAPLGVYDLNAPLNGGELEAQGAALDRMEALLEQLHAETDLTTARDWGLEQWSALFGIKPATWTEQSMRESLWALMRIGQDGFTREAMQDALTGSGLRCQVAEAGKGVLQVWFPEEKGIPRDFDRLQRNIEAILPVHLAVEYLFFYLRWSQLEERGWTWANVAAMDWDTLERDI